MSKTIIELYGIDVSEFGVVQLSRAAFQSVNFDLYPPERTHFLIYAIQFQLKLPKQKTMIKSEKKNEKQTNKKKKVIEKAILQPSAYLSLKKIKIPFTLPCKYGPRPMKIDTSHFSFLKISAGLHRISGSGLNSRISNIARTTVQPVSSLLKSKSPKATPKKQNKALILKSSQQIILKSARNECRQNIQKWRQQHNKSKSKPKSINLTNSIPEYYKKKKANQKRRRLQKHQLIKKNKKQLVEIYGEAIFKRGWPVSRKEIKEKLGIKDSRKSPSLGGISDLMKMTTNSSLSRNSIKNYRSPPIQLNSFVKPYSAHRQIMRQQRHQPVVKINPNDFPSLLESGPYQSSKKNGKKK